MRRHGPDILESVKKDRAAGLSISALVQKYSLAKTTIWYHVRNVEMPDEARKLIRSYQGGSKIQSQNEWNRAKEEAASILSKYNEDLVWPILLAALYWSEGTKRSGFVFTNTDGSMIKVFLKILRGRLRVQDEDLDVLIRTCSPMNIRECRAYWSKITGILPKNIRINHDDKQNKSKTEFGMCRVTLRRGGYRLKLTHCLIRELVAKMACA